MLQQKVISGTGVVDNGDQIERSADPCIDVLTEERIQRVGSTNDAAVRDHSRVFADWKQQVRDDHWARMFTECIDEGLPN